MGDDPPEFLKAELEREKLRLEVAELKRPLWRRASTLTSLLPPLTVALLTVGLGWWTGLFDRQRLVLQAERSNLEARTQVLTRDEQDLKDRKTGLQAQVRQLEGQVKQSEATLAQERDKAQAEREQLREKLAADLRDQKTKAEKDLAAVKRTVDEARDAARRSPVVVWLDLLTRKDPSRVGTSLQAADELSKLLDRDSSLASLVTAEYEKHSGDDLVASSLLRVLYATSGEARWLEKIAAKLAESDYTENQYWRDSTLLRLRKGHLGFLEKVLKLVPNGSTDDRRTTVMSLANSFEGELSQRAFSTEDSYFSLLRLARDEALARNRLVGRISSGYSPSYVRQRGLRVVRLLSAEGAIAISALLITTGPDASPPSILPGATIPFTIWNPSVQSSELAQLERDFRGRLADKAFRAEAVRLGVIKDESDVPQWRDWMRDNQGLVAEWTEPDLAKVRKRLSGKTH